MLSGISGTIDSLNADTVDGKHIWCGTQEEYNGLASSGQTDKDTIYMITDIEEEVQIDLSVYQTIIDNDLKTDSKNIPDAINSLYDQSYYKDIFAEGNSWDEIDGKYRVAISATEHNQKNGNKLFVCVFNSDIGEDVQCKVKKSQNGDVTIVSDTKFNGYIGIRR